MKIFLDANIIIAAAGSASGGSYYLWRVAERDERWQLVTTAYAIAEARANVIAKLPTKRDVFSSLITSQFLTIVQPPPAALLQQARGLVPPKDEPILAAALFCRVAALCTLDQKDFHNPAIKKCARRWNLRIVTPKNLLEEWRAEQSP